MSDPLGNKQYLSRILESGVVVSYGDLQIHQHPVKMALVFICIPPEVQIMLLYILHTIKTQFHKSRLNGMNLYNSYPSL